MERQRRAAGEALSRLVMTDGGKDVHQTFFVPGEDTPHEIIVEFVASVLNKNRDELPPIEHAIDTDALESLISSERSVDSLSFVYDEVKVKITSDGKLWVYTNPDAV